MKSEFADLMPKSEKIPYGKREVQSFEVWPLSIGDQFKLTDLVAQVVAGLLEKGSLRDSEFVGVFLSAIKDNVHQILAIVGDLSEDQSKNVIDQMTNRQLMYFVECVWDMNYEDVLKNANNLFERVRGRLPSDRLSQQSLKTTQATPSKKSSKKGTKKGA